MSVDTTVKGVLTTHTILSGTMTTPDGAILGVGDRCLVAGQNDPIQNGIYYVDTASWAYDEEFHLYPAVSARIFSGSVYKHSEWILNTEADVLPGVGVQNWVLDKLGGAGVPGDGMTRDGQGHMVTDATGVSPGVYQNPNITVLEDGRIASASASNIVRSYQEGLEVQYVNATTLRVLNGAAFISGISRIVEMSTVRTLTPSLAANTQYYVYLYDVNGVGQIDISTTGPAAAYLGTAKNKLGDDSMRYLGQFKTLVGSAQLDSASFSAQGQASQTAPGIVELATDAEASAQTDDTRALTPGNLAALLYAPLGSLMLYAGATVPSKWRNCDGGEISRTTYAALYDALGGASSPWGQGDGSTTFNVPDLRGRAPIGLGQGTGLTTRTLASVGGAETHVLTGAQLPPHTHATFGTANNNTQVGGSGARVVGLISNSGGGTNGDTGDGPGTSTGHNNMQPFLTIRFIIRIEN